MKLKLRLNKRSCRVEVPGPEPSLTDLIDHIKQEVLTSVGLSPETDFSLSLNGSEILTDTGQNLSSFGVVSGDLIYVILPDAAPKDAADPSAAPVEGAVVEMSSAVDDQSLQGASQSEERGPPTDHQPSSSTSSYQWEDMRPSTSRVHTSSWFPILCCEAADGEAPLPLQLLYRKALVESPVEALVVAINLLMLETGFTGSSASADEMPDSWRAKGKPYKLSYHHHLCENTPVKLVALPMGPMLFIHASIKANSVDITRKLCLDPMDFLTNKWPGENTAAAFKDLKRLSQMFKDKLAYPLIAVTREALCLPVVFGLTALPPEVLLRILRQLDVKSVVRLSAVCKYLNTWTSDSMLWSYLCHRDLKKLKPDQGRNPDWKEVYKAHYRRRQSFSFPMATPMQPPFPLLPNPLQPFPFQPLPFQPLPFQPLPLGDPLVPIFDPPLFDPFHPLPDPLQPLFDPLNPILDPLNPILDPRPRVDLIHPLPNRGRHPFSGVRRGQGHGWQRQGFR